MALAGAGDVNADGFDDLLIGEPAYDVGGGNRLGRVLLFFGGAGGFSTSPDLILPGEQPDAKFGWYVAGIGDVNGDQIADFAVTAMTYSGAFQHEGKIYLYHGRRGGPDPAPAWTHLGGSDFKYLTCAEAAGDVNGDGLADLAAFAADWRGFPDSAGELSVFLGRPTGLPATPDWRRRGTHPSEYYGLCTRTAGDVNGDGFGDVAVGTMRHRADAENQGKAEVFLGGATGLGSESAWSHLHHPAPMPGGKPAQNQHFGNVVGTAGDVNGDGIADFFVTGYFVDHGDTDEGRVFVWHGNTNGLNPAFDWSAEANQPGALLGNQAAGVGDVNGDGYDDLLVAARTADHGQVDEGVIALYHGSARGLSTWPAWTSEGDEPGAELGGVVEALGDVNGDGLHDFAASSLYHQRDGRAVGQVRVYSGRAGGLEGSSGWTPRRTLAGRTRHQLDRAIGFAGWRLAVGAVLLAILAGGLALRWRRRPRPAPAATDPDLARSREHVRIAYDLHDMLAGKLAEICRATKDAERRLEDRAAVAASIERISVAARDSILATRELLWELREPQTTLEKTVSALGDFVERFAESHALRFRQTPAAAFDDRPIRAEFRHNLFMIVREATNNIAKHARASLVNLTIRYDGGSLVLVLEDDGVGCDASSDGATPRGHGLHVMNERARQIGGTLTVTRASPTGTRVQVTVPVPRLSAA